MQKQAHSCRHAQIHVAKHAHWNCSTPVKHRRAQVNHASRTHRQLSGTWISLLALLAALDPLGPSLQGGSRECRRAPHPLTQGASRGRWQRLCNRKAISTSDQCDLILLLSNIHCLSCTSRNTALNAAGCFSLFQQNTQERRARTDHWRSI
jgi:hypothetical protein